MSDQHILVVDDDEAVRHTLHEFFLEEGYHVTAVADGPAAIEAVGHEPVQVMITDLRLPHMDGCEVVERVLHLNARVACIVMTGYGTIESAVKAMKAGAVDFVTKPIQLDAVSLVVKKAIELQQLRQENTLLRKTVREQFQVEHLIGTGEAITKVHDFVKKVADTDSTVLIQGESGTGKELVARMLHFNSFRRDRPLVPVNCAAIPETLLESELFGHEKGAFTGALNARMGRFELANGGTLFLDEVGEMSQSLQVRLLRALQERAFERVGGTKTIRVDVRIIAATNQDLDRGVQEGRFRKDLYYRLNVLPITIPPLRERRGDIPLLLEHFLRKFNQTKLTAVRGVDADAMRFLTSYTWPGNVRELENVVERMVILKKTGTLGVEDLPEEIVQSAGGPRPTVVPASLSPAAKLDQGGINLAKELERYENQLILEALRQANGVTSRAAQLLYLNRTTLVEKLKRKGLVAKVQPDLCS